ncbi:MAG: hypothetical protein U0W24_19710 [Bacteroidales bacterium]
MKNSVIVVIFLFIFSIVFSCNQENSNEGKLSGLSEDTITDEIPEVKNGSFYQNDSIPNSAIIIADTITYNVVVKNSNPEDDWMDINLKHLNRKAFINIIFNAIYNGNLVPYDYQSEKAMTIEEVKLLEKEHPRKEIGNILFIESWYFNEKEMILGKKVYSVMMAYERITTTGEIRYKSGIQVFFDKNKNIKQK